MAITLPELPYAKDALAPHISQETVTFHYGKHHAGYVNKLNAKIEQDSTLDKPLVELIRSQSGAVYNPAAQSFNHAFYW
ncbi:MAG TPA: superoxide dismutase [Fe], partial [Sorangium sp.]|nr:superoxide dismutase [Fe] [Sorangium sp.]